MHSLDARPRSRPTSLRRQILRFTLLLTLLGGWAIIATGCTEETAIGALLNRPRVVLVEMEEVQTDTRARFRTVVRNNGDGIAYGASVEIRLARAGTIIETNYGTFGRVEPGQRVQDEITLLDVDSHDDYDSLECRLSWQNARGRVFTGGC